MEKILTIDGRQVKFKSTGALLLRYKSQFKQDALKEIFKLLGSLDESNNIIDIDSLDLEVLFNLAWTLAKTANPDIEPPMEWLDTFSEFPLMEIMPDLVTMITGSITSTVPSKKK